MKRIVLSLLLASCAFGPFGLILIVFVTDSQIRTLIYDL